MGPVKVELYFRLPAAGFPSKDAKYIVGHFQHIQPKPSVERMANGTFIAVFIDRQHSPQITFFGPGDSAAPELVSALLQKGYVAQAWNMTGLYKEISEKVLAWKERREYVPERSAEAKAMIDAFKRVQKGKPIPAK
jgi:hypothetical protein